jgi:putative ABC transport system ATP-binding protein
LEHFGKTPIDKFQESIENREMIEINQVSKSYTHGDVKTLAVADVSLCIEPGEFLALVGPSGSGKTTLLNMMGALDRPTSGQILFDGLDLCALDKTDLAKFRRDKIGFIFQAFNLLPVLSALENTEFVLSLRGVAREERLLAAKEMLKIVGLEGLEGRRPDQLSGGQQQRVAVARAMVAKPMVILADEPTANLDSKTAESLLDVMDQLNREYGVTFVFSTHDEKITKRARRIVHMQDGTATLD